MPSVTTNGYVAVSEFSRGNTARRLFIRKDQ